MRFNGIKTSVGCSLLLLAGLGCNSPKSDLSSGVAAKLARSELGMNLSMKEETLSNGLRVVMVEDHTVPIVSYQSWFRVGSVDEKPGITGISHLFEHLMFKGTDKYGPREFFMQLEAKGAEVNAFTTRDYTAYYENIVPSLLEKVIDMESDRMANLKLNDDVLNSERMVVLEERRMRSDNSPEGKMDEALWHLAFHVHPYQWPVIGYPQDVLSITVPELNDYFRAHYQPANASLVVVGDIDPKKTLELIKNYYEKIPAQPQPKRDIAPEPEQDAERRLVMHDDVASERFEQAYHVPSAKDDDSYSLDVLANILFAGTSSRAYQLLVEQKDVAMSVSGVAFTPTYPGLFLISGTMKQGQKTETAEAMLDQVIREVQDHGVTEEEVKTAVRQLTVQLVDSVQTPSGLATMIGTVQTILGSTDEVMGDLAKYLKVTPADVQRVARKYMIPNHRSVVILAPGRAKADSVKAVSK
jgi:zinc protease